VCKNFIFQKWLFLFIISPKRELYEIPFAIYDCSDIRVSGGSMRIFYTIAYRGQYLWFIAFVYCALLAYSQIRMGF